MPSEQTIRFHHWTGYYIEAVRRLHAVLSQCLLLMLWTAPPPAVAAPTNLQTWRKALPTRSRPHMADFVAKVADEDGEDRQSRF
jgi:hypothetical protein